MATHKYYEAGSFTMSWYSIDLAKGGGDTFLTIEPRGKAVSVTTDAQGKDARAKMANQGATITVNMLVTSEAAEDIYAAFLAQTLVGAALPIAPFFVKDAHGITNTFLAQEAVLTDKPTLTFDSGETVPEITFVWECEQYFLGRDAESIASNIKALSEYL